MPMTSPRLQEQLRFSTVHNFVDDLFGQGSTAKCVGRGGVFGENEAIFSFL